METIEEIYVSSQNITEKIEPYVNYRNYIGMDDMIFYELEKKPTGRMIHRTLYSADMKTKLIAYK